MYTRSVWKTEAKPEVRHDNNLGFNIEFQEREVPAKQAAFLEQLGWEHAMSHPDTGEQLWHKQPPATATDEERAKWDYQLSSGYWHWYEAVAYEFTKFISIGED